MHEPGAKDLETDASEAQPERARARGSPPEHRLLFDLVVRRFGQGRERVDLAVVPEPGDAACAALRLEVRRHGRLRLRGGKAGHRNMVVKADRDSRAGACRFSLVAESRRDGDREVLPSAAWVTEVSLQASPSELVLARKGSAESSLTLRSSMDNARFTLAIREAPGSPGACFVAGDTCMEKVTVSLGRRIATLMVTDEFGVFAASAIQVIATPEDQPRVLARSVELRLRREGSEWARPLPDPHGRAAELELRVGSGAPSAPPPTWIFREAALAQGDVEPNSTAWLARTDQLAALTSQSIARIRAWELAGYAPGPADFGDSPHLHALEALAEHPAIRGVLLARPGAGWVRGERGRTSQRTRPPGRRAGLGGGTAGRGLADAGAGAQAPRGRRCSHRRPGRRGRRRLQPPGPIRPRHRGGPRPARARVQGLHPPAGERLVRAAPASSSGPRGRARAGQRGRRAPGRNLRGRRRRAALSSLARRSPRARVRALFVLEPGCRAVTPPVVEPEARKGFHAAEWGVVLLDGLEAPVATWL